MTDYLRPEFTPGILPTYVGYHLQIFGAGRAKISLQTVTNNKKHEFFAARPERDRTAYQRQKARSEKTLSDHVTAGDAVKASRWGAFSIGYTKCSCGNALHPLSKSWLSLCTRR